MKIYVTGASGFIGGRLAAALSKQHDVIRLSRGEYEAVNFEEGSIVIHAGAKVHSSKEKGREAFTGYVNSNTRATLNLAKRALSGGAKCFVFLSSVLVMGNRQGLFREDDVPTPETPYAMSKFAAEDGLKHMFTESPETSCIVLRLPMVWGKGAKGNAALLEKLAGLGIPLPLAWVKAKRSFLHIDTLVSSVEAIISATSELRTANSKFAIYNLSDEDDMTSGELYSKIYRQYHSTSGVFPFPEKWLKVISGWPLCGFMKKLVTEYRFPAYKFRGDFSSTT